MDTDQAKRRLGTEWKDWNGQVEPDNGSIATSKTLFLQFLLIYSALVTGILLFLNFMIEPRLELIHPLVQSIISWSILSISILIGCMYLLFIASIYLRVNLLLFPWIYFKLVHVAYQTIQAISSLFAISIDRLSHSYIQINNRLMEVIHHKKKILKTLVLLPRCLLREVQNQIKSMDNGDNMLVFTCVGGDIARKHVKEHRPQAVIAVACERDLLTGLFEFNNRIPVYAIPNIRPEGPCLNTLVPINEIKKAISLFVLKDAS